MEQCKLLSLNLKYLNPKPANHNQYTKAWIQIRRGGTQHLVHIQAVWHSDNIFTNFEQHWSTLRKYLLPVLKS